MHSFFSICLRVEQLWGIYVKYTCREPQQSETLCCFLAGCSCLIFSTALWKFSQSIHLIYVFCKSSEKLIFCSDMVNNEGKKNGSRQNVKDSINIAFYNSPSLVQQLLIYSGTLGYFIMSISIVSHLDCFLTNQNKWYFLNFVDNSFFFFIWLLLLSFHFLSFSFLSWSNQFLFAFQFSANYHCA